MMFPAPLEEALIEVELRFNDVSRALVSGEPVALAAASAALRQASIGLSELLPRLRLIELDSKNLKSRLKKIADGMSTQREGLIRRTVVVERALNAIVPASGNATYGQASGPYGSLGKQTGAFKYLAA